MLMFSLIFLLGLLSFALNRKHMLMMLLSLEFIVLSLYLLLFLHLMNMSYEYFMCMIFLTMSVCEGVLGLSVLISMIRSHGNDYMMNFTFLW